MPTYILLFILIVNCVHAQPAQLSVSGFTQWRTGHDTATQQFLPAQGDDPLTFKKGKVLAVAKFKIKGYGEMSFPINSRTPEGEEAMGVNLSESSFVRITYKATHNLILQLRQTGIHGGVHNQVVLLASKKFISRTIYFTEFKDGKTPLDLSDVAKFNFAFLGIKDEAPYVAELTVRGVEIQNYKP